MLVRALRTWELAAEPKPPAEGLLGRRLRDVRPSAHTRKLEYMDLVAVKECTDARFLPARYRDMAPEDARSSVSTSCAGSCNAQGPSDRPTRSDGLVNCPSDLTRWRYQCSARIGRLVRGFLSLFISGIEEANPEALMEAARQEFRDKMTQYNLGPREDGRRRRAPQEPGEAEGRARAGSRAPHPRQPPRRQPGARRQPRARAAGAEGRPRRPTPRS